MCMGSYFLNKLTRIGKHVPCVCMWPPIGLKHVIYAYDWLIDLFPCSVALQILAQGISLNSTITMLVATLLVVFTMAHRKLAAWDTSKNTFFHRWRNNVISYCSKANYWGLRCHWIVGTFIFIFQQVTCQYKPPVWSPGLNIAPHLFVTSSTSMLCSLGPSDQPLVLLGHMYTSTSTELVVDPDWS